MDANPPFGDYVGRDVLAGEIPWRIHSSGGTAGEPRPHLLHALGPGSGQHPARPFLLLARVQAWRRGDEHPAVFHPTTRPTRPTNRCGNGWGASPLPPVPAWLPEPPAPLEIAQKWHGQRPGRFPRIPAAHVASGKGHGPGSGQGFEAEAGGVLRQVGPGARGPGASPPTTPTECTRCRPFRRNAPTLAGTTSGKTPSSWKSLTRIPTSRWNPAK